MSEAAHVRNDLAHGGTLTAAAARAYEARFLELLHQFRGHVGHRFAAWPLVSAGSTDVGDDLHRVQVYRLQGVDARADVFESTVLLRKCALYLVDDHHGHALRLLPFVHVTPEDGAPTGAYFYAKHKGEKLKFVSHHAGAEPERWLPVQGFQAELGRFLGVQP